jgi:hypothetical protein
MAEKLTFKKLELDGSYHLQRLKVVQKRKIRNDE